MLAEISMGYTSLKTALGIIKGLNATATQVQINDAKIALQTAILEAQESLSAANETQIISAARIRELEEEIARLETWDTETEKYELKDIGGGSVAFMLKKDAQASETPHWLCANCFNGKRKSFLQYVAELQRLSVFQCHVCGAKVVVPTRTTPESLWG
ncbi:hypothetical protein ACFOOP_15045 [Marinicaulis aureus]|uniref:Uncharacterized protein n=1 Tax=Hyphococcus aureus TaxID=2666033 RepID=A0ABW1L1I3_9PROT